MCKFKFQIGQEVYHKVFGIGKVYKHVYSSYNGEKAYIVNFYDLKNGQAKYTMFTCIESSLFPAGDLSKAIYE